MKIEITKNTFVEGKAVTEGDVVDTKHASLLIGCGKAKAYVEAPKAEPKAEIKQEAKPKPAKKHTK